VSLLRYCKLETIKVRISSTICVGILICLFHLTAHTGYSQASSDSLVTLSQCWRYESSGLKAVSPGLDAVNLYIAEEGGRVSAISLSNGLRLWSTELGGEVRSNIVTTPSSLFLIASDANNRSKIRALSTASGLPTYEVDIPFSEKAQVAVFGGQLVVVSTGLISFISIADHKTDWSLRLPNVEIKTLSISGDKLLISTNDKRIHHIDLNLGKELRSTIAENEVSATGFVDSDILFGDTRGNLVRQNREGRSWRLKSGAKIVKIMTTERGIIAASSDNFVYGISGYNGDIHWKKRLPGRISDIAIVGSFIVAQTIGDPTAMLLNLDDGKQVGQFSIDDENSFVLPPLDAKGNVLFFSSTYVVEAGERKCYTK